MIKTVEDFKQFVKSEGKFFSVTFTKKDGSKRKMVARLGARIGLSGRGMLYDASSVNNIVVYSVGDRAYRTINIDRLMSVKAYGLTYTV